MIYHKHHIIPKHIGGTNDTTNIVLLSVEEHAEAHMILYYLYRRNEDYLAWQGLSNCIDKQELIKEKMRIGGLKSKGRIKSEEEKKKISDSWTIERKQKLSELSKQRFLGKKKSPEHIQKMKGRKLSPKTIELMKIKQIKNNFGGKKIYTPFGIFPSIKECSRRTNINVKTISYRAKKEIMGYKFIGDE